MPRGERGDIISLQLKPGCAVDLADLSEAVADRVACIAEGRAMGIDADDKKTAVFRRDRGRFQAGIGNDFVVDPTSRPGWINIGCRYWHGEPAKAMGVIITHLWSTAFTGEVQINPGAGA